MINKPSDSYQAIHISTPIAAVLSHIMEIVFVSKIQALQTKEAAYSNAECLFNYLSVLVHSILAL